MKGIDISHWQGAIDWEKVRGAGVEFAVIKATEGSSYTDPRYTAYKAECPLPMGFYHFLRTADAARAKEEAGHFLAALAGAPAPMGCWLDCESPELRNGGKAALTGAALAFLELVEAAGYRAGVYCNRDWARNCLDLAALTQYRLWYARYRDTDLSLAETGRQADLWQYTSGGRVPGVSSARVDMDEAFFAPKES